MDILIYFQINMVKCLAYVTLEYERFTYVKPIWISQDNFLLCVHCASVSFFTLSPIKIARGVYLRWGSGACSHRSTCAGDNLPIFSQFILSMHTSHFSFQRDIFPEKTGKKKEQSLQVPQTNQNLLFAKVSVSHTTNVQDF